MARRKNQNDGAYTSYNGGSRNRASPARLVKLYKHMSPAQRNMIVKNGFGGLLRIGTSKLPMELVNWVVSHFDVESGGIAVPGRGTVWLTTDAVYRALELPKGQSKVMYEFNVDAIAFVHEKYKIQDARAPSINAIVRRLEENKVANEDYLMSWILLAVSTFLCPTTGLTISPKCYPAVLHLSKVNELNWCQFVVDSLKKSALKSRNRCSAGSCLFVLVIPYLDSLDIKNLDIPACKPRVAAWSGKLIQEVIRLDTKPGGGFGKLKLKQSDNITIIEPGFLRTEEIEKFVFSKVKSGFSNQRKRKLCKIVNNASVAISQALGNLIEELCDFSGESNTAADYGDGPSTRQSRRSKRQCSEDETDDPNYGEDGHESSEYEEDTGDDSTFEDDGEDEQHETSDEDDQESDDQDADLEDQQAQHD